MIDLTSIIRTWVPVLVGWGLTRLGEIVGGPLDVDGESLTTAAVAGTIAVYYAAVRAAEHKWPQAGWLLGSPKQPTY